MRFKMKMIQLTQDIKHTTRTGKPHLYWIAVDKIEFITDRQENNSTVFVNGQQLFVTESAKEITDLMFN